MPTLAWGSKNAASSEQITMSASLMKYWPPPAHRPCTATTSGFQHRWCELRRQRHPGSKLFHTFAFMKQAPRPSTSTPVEKARSPLACSTATWISSVSRTVSHAQVRSARHRVVERVQGVGPVERDRGDPLTDIDSIASKSSVGPAVDLPAPSDMCIATMARSLDAAKPTSSSNYPDADGYGWRSTPLHPASILSLPSPRISWPEQRVTRPSA